MSAASLARRFAQLLLGWLVVALLLLFWQLYAKSAQELFLPTFDSAASATWHLLTRSTLTSDVLPSVGRFAAGYAIGCAIGVAIGTPLGYLRELDPWVRPVLEFLRALPAAAILPLALLLLGTGGGMRVTVIAFGTCWPVLLNAVDGARDVDPVLIETGKINGLGRYAVLRRIVLPASLPQIFAGLRTALGIALIVMVLSEMYGASSGLGYFILTAQRRFEVPETYGGVLVLGIIGWLFSVLFARLERRALAWHYGRLAGDSSA
jgi:ABC-type nitrate/sulfonate/bicarbonate transport system permease component